MLPALKKKKQRLNSCTQHAQIISGRLHKKLVVLADFREQDRGKGQEQNILSVCFLNFVSCTGIAYLKF